MKALYPILAATGAVVGCLVGAATRPSVLGVSIPLEVLTSSAPLDAPFKDELFSHLTLTTGIGLVAGCVLAFVVVTVLKSKSVA